MDMATVRVLKFCVWAADGAVRPVATLTEQAVAAVAAAVPTVKTIWAVVWPELETAAVNVVVEAQPDAFSAVGADEPDKRGRTRVTVSACASAATAVKA
jgi:predicted phosphoribosyltransferase